MSATSGRVLAIAVTLAAGTARGADPNDGRTILDEHGRALRVRFDLGQRLYLGGVWVGGDDAALDGGLTWRERDDEGVRWKLDHALVTARWSTRAGLDATLYRGLFLRWSEDGALIIPTSPPTTVRLPFDVGFDVRLARLAFADRTTRATVGVGAADLVFHFWRAATSGDYLLVRTGLAYDLAFAHGFGDRLEHVVTPFSRVGLDLAHHWDSGREAIAVRAAFSRRLRLRGDQRHWSGDAEATAEYEVIVAAVNDCPLSLRVEGGFDWGDDVLAWRGGLGLRIAVPTD